MNTHGELGVIVADWLEDRVVDPPHGSLASALARAEGMPQQRRWWLPRFGRPASQRRERPASQRRERPASQRRERPPGDRRGRRYRLGYGATAAAMVVAVLALAGTIGLQQETTDPVTPAVTGTTYSVAADGADFSTIGEAVAAAAEGDTILVGPGTFEEALIIDKDITLASSAEPPRETVLSVPQDAPAPVVPLPSYDRRSDVSIEIGSPPVGLQVIDTDATIRDLRVIGDGDGIALLVVGGAPTLEGLTLVHAGPPVPQVDLAGGLFVEGGSAASIHGLEVWYRVRIGGGSAPTISDSHFHSAELTIQDGSDALISGSTVSGGCSCSPFVVVGGSSATLRDNWFSQVGLEVRGRDHDGTSAVVEMNAFNTSSETAVSVFDSATATITGNRFVGNQRGLYVADAAAEVRANTYVNNWNGAWLEDADVEFTDNVMEKGAYGISVISSGSPVISGNSIEDATTRGIYVADGTSPVIEDNVICGSPDNLFIAPEAAPVLGDNDICPDEVQPAG